MKSAFPLQFISFGKLRLAFKEPYLFFENLYLHFRVRKLRFKVCYLNYKVSYIIWRRSWKLRWQAVGRTPIIIHGTFLLLIGVYFLFRFSV